MCHLHHQQEERADRETGAARGLHSLGFGARPGPPSWTMGDRIARDEYAAAKLPGLPAQRQGPGLDLDFDLDHAHAHAMRADVDVRRATAWSKLSSTLRPLQQGQAMRSAIAILDHVTLTGDQRRQVHVTLLDQITVVIDDP
jgi:hypothetical protein